jgi:hypothetical protein
MNKASSLIDQGRDKETKLHIACDRKGKERGSDRAAKC